MAYVLFPYTSDLLISWVNVFDSKKTLLDGIRLYLLNSEVSRSLKMTTQIVSSRPIRPLKRGNSLSPLRTAAVRNIFSALPLCCAWHIENFQPKELISPFTQSRPALGLVQPFYTNGTFGFFYGSKVDGT